MRDPTYDELRRLFHLSRDFMCVAGLDGYFKRLNPAWARLGYSIEELCARPFIEFVHPDDRTRTRHELERRLTAGHETVAFENRYLARDGSIVWLRWNAAVELTREMVYAIAIDITEQKLAEEELGRTRDEALASSRLKSNFLAHLSHEVLTPLNGILSLTHLLCESNLPASQQQDIATIGESAQQLLTLFDQLLDFANLEREDGTLELAWRRFDLVALLERTATETRPRARQKGLVLGLHVDPAVPSVIRGDPGRIRQVLDLLLDNAIKFTDEGRIDLHVHSTASPPRVRFAVEDTGIGLPSHDSDRVFEPFQQADDSDRRAHGGLGLGLATVQRLVDLMNGRIETDSSRERGTRLVVDLPLAGESNGHDEAPHEPTRAPADGPRRVLIVEDNEVNQQVALRFLEEVGYECEVASNGIAALQMVASNSYDLILMDAQMPEMDGYTTTREIRARELGDQHVPIIGVTADALRGSRQRCLSAGMDDFLTKPIEPERLFELVARHVTQKPSRVSVRLERLNDAADGEREFERTLVDVFLSDLARRLDGLGAAAEAGDAELVRASTHSIKGASQQIGATRLARAAERLEKAAIDRDVAALAELAAELELEAETARAELLDYVSETADADRG